MKVDSFGCLIPGCQLDDTTAVSGSPEQTARLAIFPNPASDFLHFELRSAGITGPYTARIVDANGKKMTEIPTVSTHTTYTLHLWHWPPGRVFPPAAQGGCAGEDGTVRGNQVRLQLSVAASIFRT